MGLLEGKKALIFGLANHRSVAWGIAQAMHKHGAKIGLSYAGKKLERRAKPLAESIGCTFLEECDVSSDESIQKIADKAADEFGEVDILVHSIAFANREEVNRSILQHQPGRIPPCPGYQCVLPGSPCPCFSTDHAEGRKHGMYELLRRNQGSSPLQCHGCRQSCFGILCSIPGI